MTSYTLHRLTRAVLGGFLIGSSLIGYAQDNDEPGVLRITSAPSNSNVPVQNAGYGKHGGYVAGPDCYGDCQACPPGRPCKGKPCFHGHGCLHCKKCFCEHYGKHSPDYGFSVPEKNPIYRRGVQYNQYYPAAWYGTPGGGIQPGAPIYPTVYQPTDTTQLGYYYQHVPFWMPNPNALPPRPIPSQWHVLAPPVQHQIPYGTYGYQSCWHHAKGKWGRKKGGEPDFCPPGDGWVETPGAAPTDIQSMPATSDPVPTPEAAPTNDSAQNLHIRRATFEE